MQNVRGGRHTALYGDEDEVEPEDLEAARTQVARLPDLVRRELIALRPGLVSGLARLE